MPICGPGRGAREDRTRPHPRPIAPRRFMRKALWISGTIVLLVVVALVAAVLLIDVNRFREPIQSQLEKRASQAGGAGDHQPPFDPTGDHRQRLFDRRIGSFRNGPAVCHCQGDRRARRLVSAAAQTDSVDSLVLKQPAIELVRNREGRWNFSSLGGESTSEKGSGPSPSAACR